MLLLRLKRLELIKSPTHSVMNTYASETSNNSLISSFKEMRKYMYFRFIFVRNVPKLKCYLSMGNSLR